MSRGSGCTHLQTRRRNVCDQWSQLNRFLEQHTKRARTAVALEGCVVRTECFARATVNHLQFQGSIEFFFLAISHLNTNLILGRPVD
jgi:hypothetical protein